MRVTCHTAACCAQAKSRKTQNGNARRPSPKKKQAKRAQAAALVHSRSTRSAVAGGRAELASSYKVGGYANGRLFDPMTDILFKHHAQAAAKKAAKENEENLAEMCGQQEAMFAGGVLKPESEAVLAAFALSTGGDEGAQVAAEEDWAQGKGNTGKKGKGKAKAKAKVKKAAVPQAQKAAVAKVKKKPPAKKKRAAPASAAEQASAKRSGFVAGEVKPAFEQLGFGTGELLPYNYTAHTRVVGPCKLELPPPLEDQRYKEWLGGPRGQYCTIVQHSPALYATYMGELIAGKAIDDDQLLDVFESLLGAGEESRVALKAAMQKRMRNGVEAQAMQKIEAEARLMAGQAAEKRAAAAAHAAKPPQEKALDEMWASSVKIEKQSEAAGPLAVF